MVLGAGAGAGAGAVIKSKKGAGAPQELVKKHNGTLRSHHTVRLM